MLRVEVVVVDGWSRVPAALSEHDPEVVLTYPRWRDHRRVPVTRESSRTVSDSRVHTHR